MRQIFHVLFPTLLFIFLTPVELMAVMSSGEKDVYIQMSDIEERFEKGKSVVSFRKLAEIHRNARLKGADTRVIYPKGKTLNITIPADAETIELTRVTDFNGCVFNVENTQMPDFFLYSLNRLPCFPEGEAYRVKLDAKVLPVRVGLPGELIDEGDFSSVPQLRRGDKMLYVFDNTEWTKRYGRLSIYRRDMIHVRDGVAQNKPIAPYSESKDIVCYYEEVDTSRVFMGNLTFNRQIHSTKKVYLLDASGQYNLHVRNVELNTPAGTSGMYIDDRFLFVRYSFNTCFEDVRVNGTYSAVKTHGYAFRMINLLNTKFIRVEGDAPWGMTCGFFLNGLSVEECRINRMDCHCYGADFIFRNTVIRNNQDLYSEENANCKVSSMFGHLIFENCHFEKVRPVLIDPSYGRAFTGFDLLFRNCTFRVNPRYYYLVEGLQFNRDEAERCLPNLVMRDCHFDVSDGLQSNARGRFFLFHFNSQKEETLYQNRVGHLSQVSMKNVTFSPSLIPVSIWLCNKKLDFRSELTENPVGYHLP